MYIKLQGFRKEIIIMMIASSSTYKYMYKEQQQKCRNTFRLFTQLLLLGVKYMQTKIPVGPSSAHSGDDDLKGNLISEIMKYCMR